MGIKKAGENDKVEQKIRRVGGQDWKGQKVRIYSQFPTSSSVFKYAFIQLHFQQIFIKHLLCVRHS